MPNLKNQPSVSDSAKINESILDGRANGTPITEPEFIVMDMTEKPVSNPIRIPQRQLNIDPSADPSFLDDPDSPFQNTVYRPKIANAPSPEDSTVQEPTHGGRSLRLQWRYFRIIAFAGWMFVRVLFWQVYVNRYFPKWVEKNNLRDRKSVV